MELFNLNNRHPNALLKELRDTGSILISDTVYSKDNDNFRDIMSKYYNQPIENKIKDIRKDISFQSGYIPIYSVKPQSYDSYYQTEYKHNLPQQCLTNDICERYSTRFCNLNQYDKDGKHSSIEPNNVSPINFPEWDNHTIPYGRQMFNTIKKVSTIIATELKLPSDYITNRLIDSPTTLSSIGYDIKDMKYNDVVKGFDCETSLLTVFGRSTYNGLNIWTNNGDKISVKIPENCLLIQAGKQLEYITGGYIQAGYNEIVITEEALNKNKLNVIPIMYAHLNNICSLSVIDDFNNQKVLDEYPNINKGLWMKQQILQRICI